MAGPHPPPPNSSTARRARRCRDRRSRRGSILTTAMASYDATSARPARDEEKSQSPPRRTGRKGRDSHGSQSGSSERDLCNARCRARRLCGPPLRRSLRNPTATIAASGGYGRGYRVSMSVHLNGCIPRLRIRSPGHCAVRGSRRRGRLRIGTIHGDIVRHLAVMFFDELSVDVSPTGRFALSASHGFSKPGNHCGFRRLDGGARGGFRTTKPLLAMRRPPRACHSRAGLG